MSLEIAAVSTRVAAVGVLEEVTAGLDARGGFFAFVGRDAGEDFEGGSGPVVELAGEGQLACVLEAVEAGAEVGELEPAVERALGDADDVRGVGEGGMLEQGEDGAALVGAEAWRVLDGDGWMVGGDGVGGHGVLLLGYARAPNFLPHETQ